jgi:hypothetical protein
MHYSGVPVFSRFYNRVPLRLPLSPSPLFFSAARRRRSPSHVCHPCCLCTAQDPATCHPGLCPAASRPRAHHPCPRHIACRLPELHFTAARHHSITRATSCLPMFHASPLYRVAALPTPCWPARASSTSLSFCPSAAAIATHAAEMPAPACARAPLLLDPERLL